MATEQEQAKGAKIQAEKLVSDLQSIFNNEREFPCRNMKAGKTCVRQYDGKLNSKGGTVLWYGADCTLPGKSFCEPCLAHWLAAVLRNVVLTEIRRDEVFATSETRR